jgi:hypothetical protein
LSVPKEDKTSIENSQANNTIEKADPASQDIIAIDLSTSMSAMVMKEKTEC